jgi:hypothetical protein
MTKNDNQRTNYAKRKSHWVRKKIFKLFIYTSGYTDAFYNNQSY